jgi:predicted transcriptional regulator
MSKITFRADDDLVERLEAFDASKSEVMREALRAYLDGAERTASDADDGSVDDALAERVDRLIEERLDARLDAAPARASERDINVNVTLEGATASSSDTSVDESVPEGERKTAADRTADDAHTRRNTCGQCGEELQGDSVYCPNCGEKAAHRVFCDCGDELRSDWAFCPGCGRRTPAADVLDRA